MVGKEGKLNEKEKIAESQVEVHMSCVTSKTGKVGQVNEVIPAQNQIHPQDSGAGTPCIMIGKDC